VYEFGFELDRGEYRIEVVVTDTDGCSSDPVSDTFTIGFETL
jgi:hypothetical protein